jgi:DNA-binding response OmpR family regulator
MALGFFKRLLAGSELQQRTSSTRDKTRTILLVSAHRSECDTIRAFSLRYGWHLLVASNLTAAVALQQQETVSVILYDQALRDIEWPEGVGVLLKTKPSACLILLSFATDEKMRLALLALGGYEVARKPVALDALAPLVNGYGTLLQEIDSVDLDPIHYGRTHRQLGVKEPGLGRD